VKVLEVDAARKRIALSMRLDDNKALSGSPKRDATGNKGNRLPESQSRHNTSRPNNQREKQPQNSAMADAFAKLKR
ncbi:MAG: hypothetical protein Q4B82_06280, partial [Alysiella sp.]|uniref:hypothetical protein n=1 Tax=Alysiella sp. TaxID=1872483 RepID=UPI0026DC52D8